MNGVARLCHRKASQMKLCWMAKNCLCLTSKRESAACSVELRLALFSLLQYLRNVIQQTFLRRLLGSGVDQLSLLVWQPLGLRRP
jgi:hypothetical protein